MSISTYAELQTAIGNWLDRSDLTSRIPEFISIAESHIAQDVRIRDMVKRVTSSTSSQYTDLPTDLLEIDNIQINSTDKLVLDYLTPEQIDERKMGSSTGTPKVYTIIGTQFQLAPAPDTTYTVEIAYYAKYAAFSADADTNNLLSNHPEIYLYGALMAAEPFLGIDQRVQTWAAMYQKAVNGVNEADQRGQVPKTGIRMRSIYNP